LPLLVGLEVGQTVTVPYSTWAHPCAKGLHMVVKTKKVGDKLEVTRIK
jgi:hypothetical protein